MKKALSLILALCLMTVGMLSASATSIDVGAKELRSDFSQGVFDPNGAIPIDYRFFSPVKENDGTKYPLVIWLHGKWNGESEGQQLGASNISYWASDEFQARFTNGGAFIYVPRSDENIADCWDECMIEPLKNAILSFIEQNSENIDLTRIYIGGYSMGGKMTLKMAIAYPEMFAAIFPVCPGWSPDTESLEFIADMPVWMTSGKTDPLVNYYFSVNKTFEKLCSVTNVPEEVRFSTLKKVCFEDGERTSSGHHSWYAVNHDMFSSENSDYPYMTTVNAAGEEITLTYPDGMISWLCSHTSNYDGHTFEGKGNLEIHDGGNRLFGFESLCDYIRTWISVIKGIFDF